MDHSQTAENQSSQIGYIIFFEDQFLTANINDNASPKSREMVWSVLRSDIFSFSDAVDPAIMISQDLNTILGHDVPLRMLTDSTSLFNVINNSSAITEKMFMIYISTATEAYKRNETTPSYYT